MNLYRQEQPGTPLFFESFEDDDIMSFGYEDYDYEYDEYEAEETLASQEESEEEEDLESKDKLAIASSLLDNGDNNVNKPSTASTKEAEAITITTNEAMSSNCSICLQHYQDQSYLNYCYHAFCYSCISQWIKTNAKKTKKPYCPLCKNKIKYIIHNIDEAKGSFLKYYLEDDHGKGYGHDNNVNNSGGIRITDKKKLMITRKRKKWIQEISSNNVNSSSDSNKSQRLKVYLKDLSPNNLEILKSKKSKKSKKSRINETDLKRIKPFITRDLKVILSDMYDEVIEEYVQSILTMYYFNGSKTEIEVTDLLKPWLKGEKITQKFLSELNEFLNSEWNIEKWDKLIKYG